MKKYKYIKAYEIEKFDDWNIEKIIEPPEKGVPICVILSKEEKPVQKEPYLSEATLDELLQEIKKRSVEDE